LLKQTGPTDALFVNQDSLEALKAELEVKRQREVITLGKANWFY